MSIFLYVIPILTIISGFAIYRHNGKIDIFKLDLVQFFYMFLLAPLFFVWAKSFVYFLLRSEVGLRLTVNELFVIDTALSVVMLYIYAFLVMHSLTKTFRLKSERDPLYDVFHHSEYIHLWLSHIVIAIGAMVVFFLLGFVNVFFPLAWHFAPPLFYLLCLAGGFSGAIAFLALVLTDPKQEGRRYMRLMKLTIGLFFLFQVSTYFLLEPAFDSQHGMYWFTFFLFATMFLCALFTYKSSRINQWFAKIALANKDTDFWGKNTQLFSLDSKKKSK